MKLSLRQRIWISMGAVVLFSVIGLRIPLLDTIGYELAVFMGAVGYVVSFSWGATVFEPRRDSSGTDFPIVLCRRTFHCMGWLLVLFSFPVLIHIVHNFLGEQCKIFSRKGIGIYLYVVPPVLIHGLGLGILCRELVGSKWKAWGLCLAYFALTSLWSLLECYVGPRMTCHNFIIGLASVGGYTGFDTDLRLDSSFYWHRALTVIAGIGFLSLTAWHRMRKMSMEGGEWEKVSFCFSKRFSLCVGLFLLVCFLFARDATGLGFGRRRLARILPCTHETKHFVLHHAQGKPSEEKLLRLGEDCEWHYYKICQALGLENHRKVHAFFYPTREEEWLATGASGFLFAVPWNREFHTYLTSSGAAALRHELVHVMAEEFGCPLLKISTQYGLVEGVAVAVDEGYCEDPSVHEAVAAAKRANLLVPAHRFVTTKGFGSLSMRRSYTFAGSFCGYLIKTYGEDPFKILYGSLFPSYEKVYGKRLDQLNEEWEAFLDGIPVSPKAVRDAARLFDPVSFPPFFRRPCPRLGSAKEEEETPYEEADRHLKEGRYDQALAMIEEFFRRENGNPKWLLRMALVYEKKGDDEKALEVLRSIPDLEKVQPVWVDQSYARRAGIHQRRREWEQAREVLRQRIAYGYRANSDSLELEIQVLSHPVLRDLFQQAAQSTPDQARDLYNEGKRLAPTSALPDFYLGHCTQWGNRSYDPYLASFCYRFVEGAEGLSHLKAVTLYQVGKAAYWAGRRDEARDCFERAAVMDCGAAAQREISDWLERLDWRMR